MSEQNNYTLREFFDKFGISQQSVAEKADISVGMMRQYVCDIKQPSAIRLKKIQKAIREIGKELKTITIQ